MRPEHVAARLAELAALYVPETVTEGRMRLRADALSPEAIASTVAARLEELRALDDLTRHLHRHVAPRSTPRVPG
jgi:hypothetical protein